MFSWLKQVFCKHDHVILKHGVCEDDRTKSVSNFICSKCDIKTHVIKSI